MNIMHIITIFSIGKATIKPIILQNIERKWKSNIHII